MATIGIIEDEKMVAKTLQLILESLGHEVVFVSGNEEEAIMLANQILPDLLILDIQLKEGGNGVKVAENINPQIPFIFLTSQTSSEVIKNATLTAPVSYILKPFRKQEIFAAVQIAITAPKNRMAERVESLFVKDGASRVRINIEEILFVKSDHIYVEIHQIDHQKTIVRESIKSFSQNLPKDSFIRIHQRYLVNRKKVKLVEKKQVQLTDGTWLPISRSYINNISSI